MDAVANKWNSNFIELMQYYQPYLVGLQKSIKQDAMGRPTALVSYKSLEDQQIQCSVEQLIDNPPAHSIMKIEYIEDIPVIAGVPIWETLFGEPAEFFDLFKTYREQRQTENSQRSIFKLSVLTGEDVKVLNIIRQLYHWTARVQAYDLYLQQERQIALNNRQIEIEGRHAQLAKELFSIGTSYLKDHQEMLTPKVAIQMIDTAAKLERLSAGLSDGRNPKYGTDVPTINVTNTVDVGKATENTIISEDINQNKERAAQLLNLMNSIGVLTPDVTQVVDIEEK